MAGEASRFGAGKMLDAMTGRATQTLQTTYLALLTVDATDAMNGSTITELTVPTTNGYARQAVTWTAPTAADPSSTENTALITFGPFTSDLGIVIACCLMESATGQTSGDEILAHWQLDADRDPANGDSITIAAGALTMTAT